METVTSPDLPGKWHRKPTERGCSLGGAVCHGLEPEGALVGGHSLLGQGQWTRGPYWKHPGLRFLCKQQEAVTRLVVYVVISPVLALC